MDLIKDINDYIHQKDIHILNKWSCYEPRKGNYEKSEKILNAALKMIKKHKKYNKI